MKQQIQWLSCVTVLISACGGTQSSSEQPETQPVVVATVVVPANDDKQREPNASKREMDAKIAGQAGLLGVFADAGVLGIGFAEGDAGDQLGAMWGDSIGESFGAGGLGLSGTGRGGGGSGHGTIGLGSVGTIGKGGGGSGAGYGRIGSAGTRTGPRMSQGNANVVGALEKDVIRRVIRRHANQFEYCYQRRLAANPNLEGKVVTRFVISPNGSVTTTQDAGSTMPNNAVKGCVHRVFERMQFPQPKGGGVVIVTYPLVFIPAADSNADAGVSDAGAAG